MMEYEMIKSQLKSIFCNVIGSQVWVFIERNCAIFDYISPVNMLIITDIIEKHFNIEFDDDDLKYEHISSLGTFTKLIQYKVQMKG